jgi:hypothetical protein
MKTTLIALCSLLSVGCGAAGCKLWYGREIDPYGQLKTMEGKIANNQYEFGHLLHGVNSNYELEQSPDAKPMGGVNAHSFTFSQLEGSRICFEIRSRVGSDAEVDAEAVKIRDEFAYVISSHASLDEWKPETPWPTPGANTIDSVVQRKNAARQRQTHKDPNVDGSPTVELCGPAPQITEKTNFLTVAAVQKGHPQNSYLLVWDFKGERRR